MKLLDVEYAQAVLDILEKGQKVLVARRYAKAQANRAHRIGGGPDRKRVLLLAMSWTLLRVLHC
jgi:hypothetical protein